MIDSSVETMLPLATVDKNMQLQLHSQALKIINNFLQAQLTFITFTGFKEYQSKLSQSLIKSKVNAQGYESCLWMRSKPLYNQKTNKYLFFLQCQSWQAKPKQLLHLLACSISYVNIIALREYDDVSYLGSIAQRAGIKGSSINHQIKYKMAQLVFIMPNNQVQELKENTEMLLRLLQQRQISNQVILNHPQIKSYAISEDTFNNSSSLTENKIMDEIDSISTSSKENSQLMYGPILTQFLKHLQTQINKYGEVDIERAQNQIQIEPAYEAYMIGIEKYHECAMNKLSSDQKLNQQQIKDYLTQSKKQALQQYYEHDGGTNLKYKRLLDDYIGHKQEQIISMCSQKSNNKNLQILEVQSRDILEDLNKNPAKINDYQFINEKVQKMIKTYEAEATGPNKHKVMAEYMRIFYPVIYGLNKSKQAELKKQEKKNAHLKNELQRLRQNNDKCCNVM